MDRTARIIGTWVVGCVLAGSVLIIANQPASGAPSTDQQRGLSILGVIVLLLGVLALVAELVSLVSPPIRRAVGRWQIRRIRPPTDTLQTEVTRAPTNPALPEVAFETQGRTRHGVPLKGKPRALSFAKPVVRVVREEDLPAILTWGTGKAIEVLRFYDGGVTLSEINTIRDTVVFTPYYERPVQPVELDTTTSTKGFTAASVIAPAPPATTRGDPPSVEPPDARNGGGIHQQVQPGGGRDHLHLRLARSHHSRVRGPQVSTARLVVQDGRKGTGAPTSRLTAAPGSAPGAPLRSREGTRTGQPDTEPGQSSCGREGAWLLRRAAVGEASRNG